MTKLLPRQSLFSITGLTFIEVLLVTLLSGFLLALGSRLWFEFQQNHQTQQTYAQATLKLNLSFDRLLEVQLLPLFHNLAKPLALADNGQWIIFATYQPKYQQMFLPHHTYLSQLIRIDYKGGKVIQTHYDPPSLAQDTLWIDNSDFNTITETAPFAQSTILATVIDDLHFSYLDLEQVPTTNPAAIANVVIDVSATRSSIARTQSLIIAPRRLLWPS